MPDVISVFKDFHLLGTLYNDMDWTTCAEQIQALSERDTYDPEAIL